jgi:hypothetical protein
MSVSEEAIVRKLLVMLVVLAACRSTPPATVPAGALYGAASPRAAVEAFLAGIRAQDLQAISAVWGTERGPLVTAGDIGRDEVEKRELIMICYFRHDEARVLEQSASGQSNRPSFRVELKRGAQTRTPTFTTAQGPQGRWFVADADVQAVRDFCDPRQQNPPGR